jgi:hypothetical protein
MTIVLVVLQANPSNAQEPKAGSDWHNVQALPIGTKVEVNARSQHLRCSLVAVTEDGLSCSHGALTADAGLGLADDGAHSDQRYPHNVGRSQRVDETLSDLEVVLMRQGRPLGLSASSVRLPTPSRS